MTTRARSTAGRSSLLTPSCSWGRRTKTRERRRQTTFRGIEPNQQGCRPKSTHGSPAFGPRERSLGGNREMEATTSVKESSEPMVQIMAWRCLDCGWWAERGRGHTPEAPKDYKPVVGHSGDWPAKAIRNRDFACANNDCMSSNVL